MLCFSVTLYAEEPLIIENGTFSWGTEESDTHVLRDITLKVKKGSLVAVVGAVGSGKSSLINAFLGEMDKVSGYINTKVLTSLTYLHNNFDTGADCWVLPSNTPILHQ